VSGVQLVQIFAHIMRPENRIEGQSEYFQVNQGIKAVYSDAAKELESLSINGTICTRRATLHHLYGWLSLPKFRAESRYNTSRIRNPKVITTSCQDVIEEYLSHHQNLDSISKEDWSTSRDFLNTCAAGFTCVATIVSASDKFKSSQ
jgi:5'-nucleotidase